MTILIIKFIVRLPVVLLLSILALPCVIFWWAFNADADLTKMSTGLKQIWHL